MKDSDVMIYCDESGNPHIHNLENPGCSKYLVFSVIKINDTAGLSRTVKKISNKHFGSKEIHGAHIGSEKRYIEVMSELADGVDLRYYALIFDKIKLVKQFQGSDYVGFYRYCLKFFIRKATTYFSSEKWRIDAYGDADFRNSMSIELNSAQASIFGEKYTFIESHRDPGIQVADIIANGIHSTITGKYRKRIFNLLINECINVEYWPPRPRRLRDLKGLAESHKFDLLVMETAFKIARDYVDENFHSDDTDVCARVEVIEFLIACAMGEDWNQFFKSEIIIESLGLDKYKIKDDGQFMSKIIAPLRDAGVVLSSCNLGYKLPVNVSDIGEYVNNVQSKILPYLSRLDRARRAFRSISSDEFDIVDMDKYPQLYKLLAR